MYIIHLHPSAPRLAPFARTYSPFADESARLCFSLPRVLFSSSYFSPISNSFPFARSLSCLFSPSRLPTLHSLFHLSPDSALPHLRRPSHESPHSRGHFHPAVAVLGGGDTGRKSKSQSQGRGRVWRRAEGKGERAGSPTLTSNKGGELMREGARADTCGYHPTPAIKPRHHEKPSNLTHLLPPTSLAVEEKKREKTFRSRPRSKIFGEQYNESPTRVRFRGSYEEVLACSLPEF